QSQLIDVDRDLRIVHRLQRVDDIVRHPVDLGLGQGALLRRVPGFGEGRAVGGRGRRVAHAKNSRALIRASAKASASSVVLYRAKDARALEVRPKRAASGSAQCWPARTATP